MISVRTWIKLRFQFHWADGMFTKDGIRLVAGRDDKAGVYLGTVFFSPGNTISVYFRCDRNPDRAPVAARAFNWLLRRAGAHLPTTQEKPFGVKHNDPASTYLAFMWEHGSPEPTNDGGLFEWRQPGLNASLPIWNVNGFMDRDCKPVPAGEFDKIVAEASREWDEFWANDTGTTGAG